RISVAPIVKGQLQPIPQDGSLVQATWSQPVARVRTLTTVKSVRSGELMVKLSASPLTIGVETRDGRPVQQLRVDGSTGALSFPLGDSPVLGLGQGGPQFDRRGSIDQMRSGQGGYQLRTHGARVPVQWLIGTDGWALFIHQPYGTFDLDKDKKEG